jgi:hypothetical protein
VHTGETEVIYLVMKSGRDNHPGKKNRALHVPAICANGGGSRESALALYATDRVQLPRPICRLPLGSWSPSQARRTIRRFTPMGHLGPPLLLTATAHIRRQSVPHNVKRHHQRIGQIKGSRVELARFARESKIINESVAMLESKTKSVWSGDLAGCWNLAVNWPGSPESPTSSTNLWQCLSVKQKVCGREIWPDVGISR